MPATEIAAAHRRIVVARHLVQTPIGPAEEDPAIVRAANAQHGNGVGGDAEPGGDEAKGASSAVPVRGAQTLHRRGGFEGQGAELDLLGSCHDEDPFDGVRENACLQWVVGADWCGKQ